MTEKTEEIRVPTHLDRYEKAKFRAVLKRISAAEVTTNEGQAPLICDLIEIDGRMVKLAMLLDRVAGKGVEATSIAEFLSVSAQINATMAMRHKIERRLGL